MLTFIFGCIPINFLKIFLLNLIGHSISYKSKIGMSFLFVKRLSLEEGSKIGSFNYIKTNKLELKKNSFIGRFNRIKGPFNIIMDIQSGISKSNKIRRAYHPVTYGDSYLSLGVNAIIVSNHFLDLTRSITIGDHSIIAGIESQLWTHGYYHADKGSDRIRIDGNIILGNNVYVGSSCIFNPGISVGNAIHIGAGSVISKDLMKSGMYVSQALRHIDNDIEKIKGKLKKVDELNLVEPVYVKDK